MSTKFRGILFALIGVVLIVTGLFAVYELIRRTKSAAALQEESQPVIAMTNVVIAARNIPLGKLIAQEDVIQVEVPAEAVPPTAITRVEDVINRFIKVDLVTGEMIMVHNLGDPTNVNQDLTFILGEDYVMIAFPATDLMSKQNIIKRGDIIDILASIANEIKIKDEDGEQEETITKLYTFDALQGTEVTALVLRVINEDNNSQTTITGSDTAENQNIRTEIQSYLLAMQPQDALTIKHLKDAGAVFDIVLRAPSSTTMFDLDPVTSEYVMELYKLDKSE